GFPLGILLYPLAVLLLILLFPSRLDIAGAGWAILALGDGTATLVGRAAASGRWGSLQGALGWNPDKTIAGTTAFIVCGALGGIAIAWWVRPAVTPPPAPAFTILAPPAPAAAARVPRTAPARLDDNISVPATAAAT